MTTLAYRDGVMAADSGSWVGSACHPWAKKVAAGPDGTLFGVAGGAGECAAFITWVEGGYIGPMPEPERVGPSDDSKSSFVILRAHGARIELVTAYGAEQFPGAPYMAYGAGSECALGALFCGASAEKAIEAAVMHGSGAMPPVQSVRVTP